MGAGRTSDPPEQENLGSTRRGRTRELKAGGPKRGTDLKKGKRLRVLTDWLNRIALHRGKGDYMLIGFDARKVPLADEIIGQRRNRYLLKPVGTVLSVDFNVWPSIFDLVPKSADGSGRDACGLWPNLEEMEAALARSGADQDLGYWEIALSVQAASATDVPEWAAYMNQKVDPGQVQAWRLLGYHVADEGMISGLSNCGYSVAEQAQWSARLGKALNQYHLINDQGVALRTAADADQRVPEHAPFLVFGLLLVKKVSRKGGGGPPL